MSKLFYMDESGEYRELCELAEMPEIAYDSESVDKLREWREIFGDAKMPEFHSDCEPLKNLAILKEINICHSCGRIGPLPFPHMNGITYCPECLIKRMK